MSDLVAPFSHNVTFSIDYLANLNLNVQNITFEFL